MPTRYFEDLQIGEMWTSDTVTLTEEAIIAFGRSNDPQPIHTDPVAAASGRFGGLIASGWQIAALSMRLFIEAGGYGDTPVIGLGVDELRWRKPVRPGDRLHCTREVVDKRPSKSNPGVGIIKTRVSVINQDGDTVLTMITVGQVATRRADA